MISSRLLFSVSFVEIELGMKVCSVDKFSIFSQRSMTTGYIHASNGMLFFQNVFLNIH